MLCGDLSALVHNGKIFADHLLCKLQVTGITISSHIDDQFSVKD